MTKEETIKALKDLWRYKNSERFSEKETREALEIAIETLEATPRGKWIKKTVSPNEAYRCSVCGGVGCSWYDFCHHCGARMEN